MRLIKTTTCVRKITPKQVNANRKSNLNIYLLALEETNLHRYMYPCTYLFSPDLYVTRANTHARAHPYTLNDVYSGDNTQRSLYGIFYIFK